MKQRLGLAFLGLVCLAFAVFVAWIFGSATVITCTRVEPAQVNCTVQETFLGWLPLGEPQTLRHVRSASLDITAASNDDGFSGLYLVLNAENGKLRIEFAYHASVTEAKDRLDAFFAGADSEITVRQTPGWFGGLCGGFLILDCLFFAGMFAVGAFSCNKSKHGG